jgi:LPXTG-site transpeptidase (sortase) family protein
VTDDSQDGADPDPGPAPDGDPTNNNTPTPIIFGPTLFDPPIGIKTLNDSGQPVLEWTMVWINGSNIVAVNAAVSDPISAGTAYVAGSLTCTPSGVTTTAAGSCLFELPSLAYPRGRIVWAGSIGPDFGATDADSAANELTITFNVTADPGVTGTVNVASISSDRNGDGDTTDANEQPDATATSSWIGTSVLPSNPLVPATGFAPDRVTVLPPMPAGRAYAALGDLWLEIPALGVKMPIVGVPVSNGTWDVSWLWDQAGWLQGTAFPASPGNSVLTGHVYRSDGKPGPFVSLRTLKWGDQVIVHSGGQRYVYEVRSVGRVLPTDSSVFRHEERPWVTLVTCQDYNAGDNTYRYRIVVRAVLISSGPDSP